MRYSTFKRLTDMIENIYNDNLRLNKKLSSYSSNCSPENTQYTNKFYEFTNKNDDYIKYNETYDKIISLYGIMWTGNKRKRTTKDYENIFFELLGELTNYYIKVQDFLKSFFFEHKKLICEN